MRPPAERPDLREDGVALAHGVCAHIRADRRAVLGEERVEVERERVRFCALERRRRERERRGEIELLWGDAREMEVLLRVSGGVGEVGGGVLTLMVHGSLRTVSGPTTSTIASSYTSWPIADKSKPVNVLMSRFVRAEGGGGTYRKHRPRTRSAP